MSKKKLPELSKSQIAFSFFAFAFGVVTLIVLLFAKASFVYNTKVGVEVSITGVNLLQALFHWKYSSVVYGDIAVPFNYYARGLTITLSFFVLIGVALISACIILGVIALVTRKQKDNLRAFHSYFVTSIFLLITFILALFMGATKILKIYCGGNKACSMQSLIIIPALTCFGAAVMHSLFNNTLNAKKPVEDKKPTSKTVKIK